MGGIENFSKVSNPKMFLEINLIVKLIDILFLCLSLPNVKYYT